MEDGATGGYTAARISPAFGIGSSPALLALFALIVLALTVISPVYAIALILMVLSSHSRIAAACCALGFVIVVFATYNVQRTPISDWIWYTRHYRYIIENGIGSYFGLAAYQWADLASVYNIAPRLTEPVFYVLCAIVGYVSGGSVAALNIAVTVAIYLPIGLVCLAIASRYTREPAIRYAVVVGACSLGVVFTLTNHLVRQELAMAMLFPFAYFMVTKRYVVAAPFAALAVLTHNSAAVVAVMVAVAAIDIRLPPRLRLPAIVVACVGIAVLARLLMGSSERVDTFNDDGAVSASVYALDAAILLAALYFRREKRAGPDFASFALALAAMFVAFLLVAYPVKLLFLRMYFYMDLVRTLCLVVILSSLMRRWPGSFMLRAAVVLAGLAYVDLRMGSSPFDYGSLLISPWMGL